MKAIDSNLLVYACLDDHPAASACERHLVSYEDWLTSEVNLVEVYRILVGFYGLPEGEAATRFHDYHDALHTAPLDEQTARAAMDLRQAHRVDFNDAVLLQCAISAGATAVATDDAALARAAGALGLDTECPIDPPVRQQISAWEQTHVPVKGLPRILARVHMWLADRSQSVAEEFRSATQAMSRLP